MSYAIIKNGQKNIVAGRVAPIVDRYSTDEVKTDKVWIDGKPIYRKCYNLGSVSVGTSESSQVIDSTINNSNIILLDEITSFTFNGNRSVRNTSGNGAYLRTYINNNGLYRVNKAGSSGTFTNAYIIIEYVKN